MRFVRTFGFIALALAGLSSVRADLTIQSGDPYPDGIAYRWTIANMGVNQTTGPLVSHVGALSFEDPINFSDPNGYFGWTHTSNWAQLHLVSPAILNIQLTRTADVPNGAAVAGNNLFPAFAIWRGTDNDGGDDHVFNNQGTFLWAEDLTEFIGNEPNSGGFTSVSKSFTLAAGDYSIVLSGHPPGNIGSGRQGYTAIFSTSAVPEPGSVLLLSIGAMTLVWRRARAEAIRI
jgi:hypothetical protein